MHLLDLIKPGSGPGPDQQVWFRGGLTGVQTLHDGRGIDQVAGAQRAREERVQVCDSDPVRLRLLHGDLRRKHTHGC